MSIALASRSELKVVRHVRTAAGQRRFGQPIGSIIVADGTTPLKHIFTSGAGKAKDSSGKEYLIGRHSGEGNWQAVTRDGDVIARGMSEEQVYVNLDSAIAKSKGEKPTEVVSKPSARKLPTRDAQASGERPGMHPADEEEILAVGKKLGKAVPPAWTDVHVADDLDNAKILVWGRDAKGRDQRVYSKAHTEKASEEKFARIKAFANHLGTLDSAIEKDAPDNDHAAALLLIRRLGMRPGSNRDTGSDEAAYGATNLLVDHVTIDGDAAHFAFKGKKHVDINLSTKDPLIVDVLRKRLAERGNQPGVQLFRTTEDKTRQYMRSTGIPDDFLLKDMRTVKANVESLAEIAKRGDAKPKTQAEFRKWRREVAVVASSHLGNRPEQALASYINPIIFETWRVDPSWT